LTEDTAAILLVARQKRHLAVPKVALLVYILSNWSNLATLER